MYLAVLYVQCVWNIHLCFLVLPMRLLLNPLVPKYCYSHSKIDLSCLSTGAKELNMFQLSRVCYGNDHTEDRSLARVTTHIMHISFLYTDVIGAAQHLHNPCWYLDLLNIVKVTMYMMYITCVFEFLIKVLFVEMLHYLPW